ncbi:hypothetical protein HDU97_002491 [Phlyctochytrium planicorne]|nr:hypothetical protein HDU97_002491 [Phlyctochytrium planicorne]
MSTIITMAAVAAIASLPINVAAQSAQCFSLPNKSVCGPDFEGVQIASTIATSLETFDNYIKSNSNLEGTLDAFAATLKDKYTCSQYPNAQSSGVQKRIRFATTFACINAVTQSASQGCQQPGKAAMCKTSCETFAKTFVARINQVDCNRSLVVQTNTTLLNQCGAWDASSAEAGAPPCYDGTPNEVTNCGFGSLQIAKEYCYITANSGTSECCSKLLKANPPPAFITNSPSAPLTNFANAYTNIRFTLSTPFALLCPRDNFNEILGLESCYNVFGHGKSQFSYNLRDRTIKSLGTGRCLEAGSFTFDNQGLQQTVSVPLMKKCIGVQTNDNVDSFKKQKWNVIAGIDAGFTGGSAPVFNVINEETGACLNAVKNPLTETLVALGSCGVDVAAVQFAGFGAF